MKKLAFLLIALPFLAWSNDIQVSNVQITVGSDPYRPVINCDVSWQNGWRIDGGAEFMDAAWVFVKYRTAAMQTWRHGIIGASSIVSGDIAAQHHPLNYGVNIFSSVDTVGTISGTISLTLDSLMSSAYGLEVQVHAIEMVKVPAGSYYVGDGNSGANQWKDHAHLMQFSETRPYHVTQDSIIDMSSSNRPTDGSSNSANILSNTGEFFLMKYEISYEQYTTFLNTLERNEQNLRTRLNLNSNANPSFRYVMTETPNPTFRSPIAVDLGYDTVVGPLNFYCDLNNNGIGNEPDDGMSLGAIDLRIMDVISYSRWCGLRMPTEFQYEKACRGPLYPVKGEYAWGSSSIRVDTSSYLNFNHLSNQGTAQEEYINPQPYTAHIGINNIMAQRCGIHATAGSETRGDASASYYGIQDLTGGATEVYVQQANSLINQQYYDPNVGTPGSDPTLLQIYILKGLGWVNSPSLFDLSNVSNRNTFILITNTSLNAVGGRLAL